MDTGRTIFVNGPAGRLAVRLYGAIGEGVMPLLLVHPVNTGGGVWRRVATALSLTRPVIVPDLRGHGASDKQGPFNVTDYAADVMAVLDKLGVERAHVAGGSIGGPVAVLLAAIFPERVVSIASFGGALTLKLPEDAIVSLAGLAAAHGGDGLLRELLPAAFGAAYRTEALMDEAMTAAGGRDGDLIVALVRGTFSTDVSRQAGHVEVPALIVNGSEDATCPPAAGEAMAVAVRGRAVRLEDVGHLPMMEVPDMVTALLADHCAKAETIYG